MNFIYCLFILVGFSLSVFSESEAVAPTQVDAGTNQTVIAAQTNRSELVETKDLPVLGVTESTQDGLAVIVTTQTNSSESVKSDTVSESSLTDSAPETEIVLPKKASISVPKLTYFVHQEDTGGCGSAFLLEDTNGVWLVSNSHVFGGSTNLTIINFEGNLIEVPSQIEIAKDRDIIRFLTDEPQGLYLSSTCEMEEPICAYGDSGGAGVLTRLKGEAVALGPDRIEISAEIIPGNSGGPVVNSKKEVVGVSTYLLRHSDLPDWIADGTRFTDTRRMALRLNDIEWESVDFSEFYRQTAALEELEETIYTTISMISILSDDIANTIIGLTDHSKLDSWIKRHNRYARDRRDTSPRKIRRNIKYLGDILKGIGESPTPDCEITISFLKDKLHDMQEACEATRKQAEALSN